jgi:hypothetical protein
MLARFTYFLYVRVGCLDVDEGGDQVLILTPDSYSRRLWAI